MKHSIYMKIKFFFARLFVIVNLLIKRKREPFLSIPVIHSYLFFPKNLPFVLKKKKDFTNQFSIDKDNIVNYKGEKIYYSKELSFSKIKRNFNSVLNEQDINSPHRYLTVEDIKEDWIIFDIGAAEGLQSIEWAKKAKKIIIFEPDPFFFNALNKTFEKTENVKIINEGVSNKKKEVCFNNKRLIFDTLSSLIKKYTLPIPNYIKVDIEGSERDFLEGADNVIPFIDCLDICTYHKPNDWKDIPNSLKRFDGKGDFSKGVIFFNRDAQIAGKTRNLLHPVFRKCLYRYRSTTFLKKHSGNN